MVHQKTGKSFQIDQAITQDMLYDFNIKFAVIMHGDIAKTDHAFKMLAKFLIQQGSLHDQRKSLTAFSGNSER